MPDAPDDPLLWAARRECARRWTGASLSGYPALSAEDETEATLAAEPPAAAAKKGKPAETPG